MAKKQHYSNHKRRSPLYYYLLIPLSSLFLVISVAYFVTKGFMQEQWMEAVYYLVAGLIVVTGAIVIQRNALIIQNRIILQEMRLRYFILTGEPFNSIERKLSKEQIAALRFASDAELLSLLEITLHEELDASQIKKKIKHWKGDYHQV